MGKPAVHRPWRFGGLIRIEGVSDEKAKQLLITG